MQEAPGDGRPIHPVYPKPEMWWLEEDGEGIKEDDTSRQEEQIRREQEWERRLARLYDAVCQVESGFNPGAVNEREGAVGPAQIRDICLDDCARLAPEMGFVSEDRFSFARSWQMFRVYLNHYGRYYTKRAGLDPEDDVLARIWNGGPNGWRVGATKQYARRVLAYLKLRKEMWDEWRMERGTDDE